MELDRPPAQLWVDPRVEVRPSPIEGHGLFAAAPIPNDTVVLRLAGRLVSSVALDALLVGAGTDPASPYIDTFTVDEDAHLVLPTGSTVHYGNHSCDPTLWPAGPYELSCRKAVAAGDELTIDYATISGAGGLTMRCRCGSSQCRRTITSDDWRLPDLQDRYGSHWVPALRQRIERLRGTGTAQPARPFDLVIFDCDGVLVDSERLTVEVEARVLTEMGWPTTADDVVAGFMGGSSAAMLAEIERRLGVEQAARFDQLTTDEIRLAFATDLREVAGVSALVDALGAAGLATCVASSGSHAKMRTTLGLTNLHDRFAGRIFSADEVEHGKPAPDLFHHAARRMGVVPARCAVIEDSVLGVRAAVAAEMTCFGFAGGLTPPAALKRAGAITFDRMSDLVALLAADGPGSDDPTLASHCTRS